MLEAINESQARDMMEKKAIPQEMINASESVAVILTQSWCPQWMAMRLWLKRLGKKHEQLKVYQLEYDRVPWFHEFMQFKETHLKNDLVPYVRYYHKGEYQGDSNFCGEDYFREKLKLN